MKKALIFCMALAIGFTLVFPIATAKIDDVNARAAAMQSLNLLKGTDKGFELDREPTRMESLVSLIRLSGLEQEALNGQWKHPFTDVADWADNYAGFAYEAGITKGISEEEFGMSMTATAQQFVTFVLRALGYSDTDGDFDYDAAIEFGDTIGIVDDVVDTEGFLRGDMVYISFNALFTNLNDSDKTLSQKLQEDGVFTADEANRAQELYEFMTKVNDKEEAKDGDDESKSDQIANNSGTENDYEEEEYSGKYYDEYYGEEDPMGNDIGDEYIEDEYFDDDYYYDDGYDDDYEDDDYYADFE